MSSREDLLKSVEKEFGEDTQSQLKAKDVIPTGSLGLDAIIGCGGIPISAITEIYGPAGGGKTMLSLSVIANGIRKFKKPGAILDMEQAFNPIWASTLGINLEMNAKKTGYKWLDLWYPPSGTGDQAVDMLVKFIESNVYSVIAIDSVDAMTPKEELESPTEDGKKRPGLKGKLMSICCRKVMSKIKKSDTAVVFINQVRDNIGVMYGDPEVTPGGEALKFYSFVRFRVSKIGHQYKDADNNLTGHKISAKCKKTRYGAPFREADFDLFYYKGLDKIGEIFKLGQKYGVINKDGSRYVYDGTDLGSIQTFRKEMASDSLLTYEVYHAVLQVMTHQLHPREVEWTKEKSQELI